MLVRKATYTCEIDVISGSATNDPNIPIQGSSVPSKRSRGVSAWDYSYGQNIRNFNFSEEDCKATHVSFS
jgi:hypothetical protein